MVARKGGRRFSLSAPEKTIIMQEKTSAKDGLQTKTGQAPLLGQRVLRSGQGRQMSWEVHREMARWEEKT